jgi:hypothetical protein
MVRKARDHDRETSLEAVSAKDLALLDAARSVLVQAREQEGDLQLDAPAYTLREVASGCATAAVEELTHRISSFDFEPEALLKEIDYWQGLAVQHITDQIEGRND